MEGTRQTILILDCGSSIANEVYKLIRDSSCHEFNIVKVNSQTAPNGFLLKNNVAILLFCVEDVSACQKIVETIKHQENNLPILFISQEKNPSMDCYLEKSGYPNSLFLKGLDACSLLEQIFYTIERAKISNEINIHDAVLRSVNYAAECFLNNSDWKTYIRDVLQKFAEASKVDQISVFENDNTASNPISSAFLVDSCISSEKSPKSVVIQGKKYSFEELGIQPYAQTLFKSRFFQSHVKDLPRKKQSLFHAFNVKSFLIIPVFTDGNWWGFIRFDQCNQEREWKDFEIEALHTTASILAAAITRQRSDARIKHLATHDYLTNLPNRVLYEDHLRGAMIRAQRSKKWVGLFMIDLDQFKKINDVYGHPFGDKILIEVGKRLQESIRASDTVARIGGDEFVIIGEELASAQDVNRVGEKILAAFKEPILCDNNCVSIYPSVGISIYPKDSEENEELMRFADTALYQAKKHGNTFNVYDSDAEKQLWLRNLQKF